VATAHEHYERGVWCEGAAETLPSSTRKKYAHKERDLAEKRAALKAKRKERDADSG
jgi:hypothetical protein